MSQWIGWVTTAGPAMRRPMSAATSSAGAQDRGDEVDAGGGFERFQVFADPQRDVQSVVLQGPADLPFDGPARWG
jgi:hypothetical protein